MKQLCVWILALLMPMTVMALEEPTVGMGPVSYVPLTPPLVGNYQAEGRLKLFKADISLRVSSDLARQLVEHNEPLIRHQLVMLFTKQTDQTLASVQSKEELRQEAFRQVRQVLLEEDPRAEVDDLLFNNLMIQ